MTYHIEFTKQAEREFRRFDTELARKLRQPIDALAHDPRPRGAQKPALPEPTYRIREGDYRIVYSVDDKEQLILVLRVRHRRHAYRGL